MDGDLCRFLASLLTTTPGKSKVSGPAESKRTNTERDKQLWLFRWWIGNVYIRKEFCTLHPLAVPSHFTCRIRLFFRHVLLRRNPGVRHESIGNVWVVLLLNDFPQRFVCSVLRKVHGVVENLSVVEVKYAFAESPGEVCFHLTSELCRLGCDGRRSDEADLSIGLFLPRLRDISPCRAYFLEKVPDLEWCIVVPLFAVLRKRPKIAERAL